MGMISKILRRNRPYAVLLFFIILVNFFVVSAWLDRREAERQEVEITVYEDGQVSDVDARENKFFNTSEIQARKIKLEALSEERPVLFFFVSALNLTIMFLILLGILLNAYFLFRMWRKDPLSIQLASLPAPRWDISDVFRAVIVFVFFGYLFAFIKSSIAPIFPILQNANFRMVSDTAFMNIVAVLVIAYFVFHKYMHGPQAIGLSKVPAVKAFITAVVGYVAFIPLLVGIMLVTFLIVHLTGHEPEPQPIVEVFIYEKEISVLWISTLFAAIFGPIAEELFFRGFMYPVVKKRWGIPLAVIATSVVFSVLHAHLMGFIPILLLGIFLTYLYEKTGSLLVPIIVHMIHNIGMVVMVFLLRTIGA